MNIAKFDEIIGGHISDNVKKTDSRYEKERNILLAELSDEGFIDAVAIHEAGHEHYFIEARCSDFTFTPTMILFQRDNIANPFKRQIASIKVGKSDLDRTDPRWLLKVAKGYAAGGECSSRLPSRSRYRGDATDRRLWGETCEFAYCDEAGLSKSDKETIAESMWIDSQNEVRNELITSDALRTKIISRANHIKVQLFPWTASQ